METGPHIRLALWKAAKAIEKADRASIADTDLGLSDFNIGFAEKLPSLFLNLSVKVIFFSPFAIISRIF